MKAPCPKCGAPGTGNACAKCGVVFAKYSPPPQSDDAPERLRALWDHVTKNWESDAAHGTFVEQCLAANQAGYAAKCYRTKTPDPIAEERLAQIQDRLLQILLLGADRPADRPPPFRYAFAFALLLLGALAAFLLLTFFARR